MVFLFLLNILSNYTEEEMSLGDMTTIGAKSDGQSTIMRLSVDQPGLIKFPTVNPNNNWSFEFTINDINLDFPERAGVYLWYTSEPVSSGPFLGIDGKTEGLMAGIEFFGKRTTLLIGTNDGKQKLEDVEDMFVMKDSVNPERFRGVKSYRLKVISTEKNFKMEIYDGDRILYDSLRFTKTPILGERGAGGVFSISADYGKNVPADKRFIIRDFHLYKREEHPDYDVNLVKAPLVKKPPRMFDEVHHPDTEIQYLISNLEHFMKYAEAVLGVPVGSSVIQNSLNTKRLVTKNNNNLVDMQEKVDKMTTQIQRILTLKEHSNIKHLEIKIGSLEDELKTIFENVKQMQGNFTKRFNYSIVLIGFCVFLWAISQYVKIRLSRKKLHQH